MHSQFRNDALKQCLIGIVEMNERGVAQPGSAPVLGTGGRRFESCRPDSISLSLKPLAKHKRGVAQPGSAPVLGTGGRRFESCRPDTRKLRRNKSS